MEHNGFILIADITGYTAYLNESELEHAKGTLTDLLELLIEHTRPPLEISRLEGDAVFSYAVDGSAVNGQTFVESIEDTYVAFRRAIELMVLNNTCRCNACANVSTLDLKFFVHHGRFVLQPVGEEVQLLGSDINLIHRLLKNSVSDVTGLRAYVLCTDAAEKALGIDGAANDMSRHREEVDDFGEVAVWVKDMHPVYEARRGAERITLSAREILGTTETDVAMTPELVWDYLNQSEVRDVLFGSDGHDVIDRKSGRIGVGSTFQCYHGERTVTQVVLEWDPFDHVLIQQRLPLPGRPAHLLIDLRLEPTAGGTRLVQTIARPTGPGWKRVLMRLMMLLMSKAAKRDLDAFRDRMEADRSARVASGVLPVPISPERLRSEAAASLEQDV